MNLHQFVWVFAAIALTLPASAAAPAKPNVVIILADDLGYGDLGCYNAESKVPTPNLDRLAREGIRFTQAYCPVAVCSPTRYALMTGQYSWRSWKKNGVLANWERPMIESGQLTLPALLKKAGYRTAGLGKWHLGAKYTTLDGKPAKGLGKFEADGTGVNIDLAAPISGGPLDRGFDNWYGFVCASEMLIFDQNKAAALLSHSLYAPPTMPGADKLTKVTMAEYLPQITDKGVAYLKERAAAGAGQPFFLYFAPYVPHIPLAPNDAFRGSTKAGEYGDFVHELDHEIGRLLKALDETGLAKETIVIFASDNGSQFVTTGENHHPNGELRGRKQLVYEGGVRTPLVARWPGHVKAGGVEGGIVGLNDLLATFSALVGEPLPSGAGRDSISLLPALLGEAPAASARNEIVLQASNGRFALRKGEWKFVQPDRNAPNGSTELYDLQSDPGEKKNLAEEKPELAAELRAQLQATVHAK